MSSGIAIETGGPRARLSVEIAIIERHLQWLKSQLPVAATRPVAIGDPVTAAEIERAHVEAILERVGNMSDTAKVTGISRRQLHRKIKLWGVFNPRAKHT